MFNCLVRQEFFLVFVCQLEEQSSLTFACVFLSFSLLMTEFLVKIMDSIDEMPEDNDTDVKSSF